MVALHDHLFVIGGFDSSLDVLDTVWMYDVATDTWSEANPLPAPVAEACAAADGDRIVVAGGSHTYPDPIAEALAYVP
jgi:N-acetylneuraminic acid mutarotase